MKRIMLIATMAIMMIASPVYGAVITQDVEIRGEIFTGDATYDYTNGAFFWFDLDKNHSSETMTIDCSGVGNRTIAEGALVYTCTPQSVSYKNSDLNDEYGGYMLMGFLAEKYICYDNRTDQLVKQLVNWGGSKDAILAINDPMELPAGYMLSAQEIDLQGDRVWLKLYKDGNEIDDSIVEGGNTYTYEDEDDVLLFSCKIDTVFRGTDSNMVVVKFVFLRSDTILDIDGGDNFGVMEVKGTSGSIVLKNDETITLDADSEVDIMEGLYFKVADSANLRYYLAKKICLVCPECPDMPECTDCSEVETTNATIVETADITPPEIVEAVPDVEPEDKPTAVPTKKTLPGFESVFALAGLLGVALIGLRQRE